MATCVDMIDNLAKFNVRTTTIRIFTETADEIVGLNQEQMLRGQRSDGKKIGKYSTTPMGKEYADMKSEMNSLPGKGNIDLKLEGDFQRDMKMKLQGEQIDIDSADWKSAMLQKAYGKDIFGLQKKSWQMYLDEIFLTEYFNAIEDKTGLQPN